MTVTLRFYAVARELAGVSEASLELGAKSLPLSGLRLRIAADYPRLAPHLSRMRFAVNEDFADDASDVSDGDEVVLLPPVAGGSERALCDVRDAPLSIDECFQAVVHPGSGGVCVFAGVVRDHAEGKSVSRLDYEAYRQLAIKDMARIIDAIRDETPLARIAVLHRVGSLAVGDLAVVVAASAPHRAEAFAVCRSVIDRIKETVPIWKKEWDAEGRAHWVNFDLP